MNTTDPTPAAGQTSVSPATLAANIGRGALIGAAELVPGVSGGTVALVTGVYEKLIGSADHVVTAIRTLISGPDRIAGARRELARADWRLIAPVLLGMALVVVTFAGVLKSFVENQPTLARGLFFGMVAMSITVPVMMARLSSLRSTGHRLGAVAIVAIVAVAAFFASGVPAGETANPSKLLVFGAAAIAICALVLPGVSGSFFLLTIGLYGATMTAIHDRDLGYIAVFGAGAIVGLALFVKLLQYLLTRHRTVTLLAMAGLLLGSLRALWPWQGEESRSIEAPATDWPAVLALGLLGAFVVGALILVERRHGALDITDAGAGTPTRTD